MAKEVRKESWKNWSLHFATIVLSFCFVVVLNLQTFGEGLDFCFNVSKEGYRLNTKKVTHHVSAHSGVDCIVQCMVKDKSCRSANFRKIPNSETEENCELLKTVDSEEPTWSLIEDESYDYYILLQPERKTKDSVLSSTPAPTAETSTTAKPTLKVTTENISITKPTNLRSCKEIKEIGLDANDGEYNIYPMLPECNQPVRIYCADMNTTNPKEYVTLPAGRSNNFALHHSKAHEELWTRFGKIRLNIVDMSVNTTDFRFATVNVPNMFHPFASAGDCFSHNCSDDHRKGEFKVDMSDTDFLLSESISYLYTGFPECIKGVYKAMMSSDGKKWSGHCGGYCGSCWPKILRLLVEGC